MSEVKVKQLLKKSKKKGLTITEFEYLKDYLEVYHSKPLVCPTLHELWEQFALLGFKEIFREPTDKEIQEDLRRWL